MRSLYRLCYRVGGGFERVAIIEASSLDSAVEHADHDLPSGWSCQAELINPEDARIIPDRFIGRLLDEDEAADLERILMANNRKKLAAPSVRRRRPQRVCA